MTLVTSASSLRRDSTLAMLSSRPRMDAYCRCRSLLSLVKQSRGLASTSEEETAAAAVAAVGSQVTAGDGEPHPRRRCAGETQLSSLESEPAGSWVVGVVVGSHWAAEVVLVGVVAMVGDDDAMLFDEW